MRPDVSALILAGGRATRLGGVAKHLLVVDGATIFDRLVTVLRPRVAEILVSARDDIPGYRTVHDVHEGAGPLAGISAGLAACTTEWLLVVPGDMPHLTGELVDHMLGQVLGAAEAGFCDAVGIRRDGLPEPLVCLLRRRVRPVIDHRIATGLYKASDVLMQAGLTVRWIDVTDERLLRNINSPKDL